MSVRERKLKDGTKVYDAILEFGYDLHGKRIRETKTFRTKKEAKEADSKAKETANALKNKTGRLTLKEYIDRCYWPIASRRLADTSLDTYEREIKKRIVPYLGDMKLDSIDRYSIQYLRGKLPRYPYLPLGIIRARVFEYQALRIACCLGEHQPTQRITP